MGNTYCYQCVAEKKVAMEKVAKNPNEEVEVLEPLEAYTWVPVWQQQNMMNQVFLACVPLPVCFERHIQAREKSAEEKAVEGGHILPARGGGHNGR